MVWGGAAVAVVVLTSVGVHPVVAAVLGLVAALVIAAGLTAAGVR